MSTIELPSIKNLLQNNKMSYYLNNLKKTIESKGLKYKDMAFDLRIDPAVISKVINGKMPPPFWFNEKLSTYEPLGIDLDTLESWQIMDSSSKEAIIKAAEELKKQQCKKKDAC